MVNIMTRVGWAGSNTLMGVCPAVVDSSVGREKKQNKSHCPLYNLKLAEGCVKIIYHEIFQDNDAPILKIGAMQFSYVNRPCASLRFKKVIRIFWLFCFFFNGIAHLIQGPIATQSK